MKEITVTADKAELRYTIPLSNERLMEENLGVPRIVRYGGPGEIRTPDLLNANQANTIKLLNKLPLPTIEAFSNLSKSYICQVRNGSRPASEKLLSSIEEYIKSKRPKTDYISLFLGSRESMGCTPKTMEFYRPILARFNAELDCAKATRQSIEKFLNRIPSSNHNLHNRHAHYRTLKAFYNWASKEYGIDNPMASIQAPILSKVILSTLTETQIRSLLDSVNNLRDKAIISTFTESGLRLSELATIKITDINFENHTIRVFGKGRKEAFAPFGDISEQYLKAWLAQYQSDNGNIWGIQRSGVVLMLRRLEAKTGITCNPHTFRRTFAVLLRKAGIDTMTIKELGRWESLEMVQRYTRSFSFQDSMKFYKSPLQN